MLKELSIYCIHTLVAALGIFLARVAVTRAANILERRMKSDGRIWLNGKDRPNASWE